MIDTLGKLCAGVDEVGRGPLAGPVVAAAVILDENYDLPGLADSKKLSAKKRSELFSMIQQQAIAWSISRMEWYEVDQHNVLQASLIAMKHAVEQLDVSPEKVLVDGNQLPDLQCEVEAIVNGDNLIPAISAASILAKVTRDQEMIALDKEYPGYGFAKHKGYPTKEHLSALERQGVCPIHRRSFAPVRKILQKGGCE